MVEILEEIIVKYRNQFGDCFLVLTYLISDFGLLLLRQTNDNCLICDGKKLSEVIGLKLIMYPSCLQNRFQYDTWIKQMLRRIMPYAEFISILNKLKLEW